MQIKVDDESGKVVVGLCVVVDRVVERVQRVE